MRRQPLKLLTNLAYAKGAYTVAIEFGSAGRSAQLLLDTGSSALAVLTHAYDGAADTYLQGTTLAQRVEYGQGAWAGPVLRSAVAFGTGEHARRIDDGMFALIETAASNFRDADGILGLAFGGLDHARDLVSYLAEQGRSPQLTWPWPFDLTSDAGRAEFDALLHQQPRASVQPLFTALEVEGVVADKFSLLIRRALVHVLDDSASDAALAADPLNRGLLILGGGEECAQLYSGKLQDIRVLHELYYNVQLIAVQVADRPRIPAPALQQQYRAHYASNAIIDSGCSFLVLEKSIYDAVLVDLAQHDEGLVPLIERFQQTMTQQQGIPNQAIDPRDWPDLRFYLESPNGEETMLVCRPAHYWQRNALRAGQSWFLLMSQLPDWPQQSILGLPLMSGHYCIFDRRADANGIVRMATAREVDI
ncbi:MAG: pepsin-like aspartic protease [Pseudomonadota bacterium]|nr:pepsin-like aspartic protease [Pseudomonadota bacterium]